MEGIVKNRENGYQYETFEEDVYKRQGLGSALLEYAQGTGKWDNVVTAVSYTHLGAGKVRRSSHRVNRTKGKNKSLR